MRIHRILQALTLVLGIAIGFPSEHGRASEQDARVTIVGNIVTISTEIVIYGNNATAETAREIESNILNNWALDSHGQQWTYLDPRTKKRYTVTFEVKVSLYGGKERQHPSFIVGEWDPWNRKNYVNCTDDAKFRSEVAGGDEGKWRPSHTKTYAHEFGHLLGLTDRYRDHADGYSYSDNGWESNIMADSDYGSVEQRNIDAIAGRILGRYLGRSALGRGLPSGGTYRDEIDIMNPSY